MLNIEWKDEYNLGIDSIDKQHQKLFIYLNDLRAALLEENREHVGQAINGLLNYGVEHFSYEENLLTLNSYPQDEDHRLMHDVYNGKLLRFKRKFEESDDFFATEILVFVKNWLLHHILTEDRKYAIYFEENGCSVD